MCWWSFTLKRRSNSSAGIACVPGAAGAAGHIHIAANPQASADQVKRLGPGLRPSRRSRKSTLHLPALQLGDSRPGRPQKSEAPGAAKAVTHGPVPHPAACGQSPPRHGPRTPQQTLAQGGRRGGGRGLYAVPCAVCSPSLGNSKPGEKELRPAGTRARVLSPASKMAAGRHSASTSQGSTPPMGFLAPLRRSRTIMRPTCASGRVCNPQGFFRPALCAQAPNAAGPLTHPNRNSQPIGWPCSSKREP